MFTTNPPVLQDNLFKDAMEYAAESKNAEVAEVRLLPAAVCFLSFSLFVFPGLAGVFPRAQGLRLFRSLSVPVLRPPPP